MKHQVNNFPIMGSNSDHLFDSVGTLVNQALSDSATLNIFLSSGFHPCLLIPNYAGNE